MHGVRKLKDYSVQMTTREKEEAKPPLFRTFPGVLILSFFNRRNFLLCEACFKVRKENYDNKNYY